VRSIESSSFVAAGFGTLTEQVAGFHRAVPSTTLDKASMQFQSILLENANLSIVFCAFSQKSSQFQYRHFFQKLV